VSCKKCVELLSKIAVNPLGVSETADLDDHISFWLTAAG